MLNTLIEPRTKLAESITKIAYDIGSGDIKTMVVAKIVQGDGSVEEVIVDKRLPVPFA